MITVKNLVLGALATNCYLLQNPRTKELLIVDPADEFQRIRQEILRMEGKPCAVLLTHGHYDHMLAVEEVRKSYGIPVLLHEKEEELLMDPQKNLSALWSAPFSAKADRLMRDGEALTLAGYRILVLHTPGHTAGSVCYYIPEERLLLSGDTLFCESYGRYDFPTSSARDLVWSVRGLLEKLPEDTRVLPGHNEETVIEHEKRYNPLA